MEVETSTGVVFIAKGIPFALFEMLHNKHQASQPKVPVIHNADKDRDEENPLDPDYIQAKQSWELAYSSKVFDVLYKMGLDLVSVPKGMLRPEDDWGVAFDELDIGFEMPENPKDRYLSWIKLVAAPLATDTAKLSLAVSRESGVPEEDVRAITDMFRDNEA